MIIILVIIIEIIIYNSDDIDTLARLCMYVGEVVSPLTKVVGFFRILRAPRAWGKLTEWVRDNS